MISGQGQNRVKNSPENVYLCNFPLQAVIRKQFRKLRCEVRRPINCEITITVIIKCYQISCCFLLIQWLICNLQGKSCCLYSFAIHTCWHNSLPLKPQTTSKSYAAALKRILRESQTLILNRGPILVETSLTLGRILGQYRPHAAENCLLNRAIKLHEAHLVEKTKI